jgi:hypothetical protein
MWCCLQRVGCVGLAWQGCAVPHSTSLGVAQDEVGMVAWLGVVTWAWGLYLAASC